MNTQKYKNGFTLAEVLITLVIIGVIAAMTIPTLINNTNKQEFVAGLKKADSTLSQALINIARNNDASPGDYTFLTNTDFAAEFAKVANVIKICNNTQQCFGASVENGNVYKFLNNSNDAHVAVDGKSFITADGQMFSYIPIVGVGTYGLSTDDDQNKILRIIVDINGQKKPNVMGRDFFYFYVINGKGIVPAGAANINDCSKTGLGITCTAKVLKENAMNY